MTSPSSQAVARCGCPESRTALSRRGLLKLAGATGLVTATTLGGARVAFAATPAPGDVLVVLSMRGGMDGLSVVVPIGDPDYLPNRPGIGVPASTLHQVDSTFGLHPALAPIFGLWHAGQVAAVHGIGQSDPTRSHFAAMAAMENAAPGTSVRTGWLDRTVGLTAGQALFEGTTMGRSTLPASMVGPNPKLSMTSLADVRLKQLQKVVPLDAWRSSIGMLGGDGDHPELVGPTRQALDAVGTAASIPASTAPVAAVAQTRHGGTSAAPAAATTAYPTGVLGASLRDVARLIKANTGIRVATVDFGGWDMHAELGRPDVGWMRDQLTELATAMAAFAADLGPAGLAKVSVVTLSEFGRRVKENGSGGLDHGHGNVSLMMGGGIRGGKVYGSWPGLAQDKLFAGGDLAVTTDYRTVLAELLSVRCGVGSTTTVFPGWQGTPLGLAKPLA
jgi:uncharacterized protein (DUF1501 family)